MQNFTFHNPTRIIFGEGQIGANSIGTLIAKLEEHGMTASGR
jgi:alcohol dehydrogenase YqhD (iron-dependent ADH family)